MPGLLKKSTVKIYFSPTPHGGTETRRKRKEKWAWGGLGVKGENEDLERNE
jgi:hypothetical protein